MLYIDFLLVAKYSTYIDILTTT